MASAYFLLNTLRRNRIIRKKREIKKEDPPKEQTTNNFYKCRVCLKEGNIPIYGNKNENDIAEYIRIFGDVEISEEDEYPKHLCNCCYSSLQTAILFRKSAKETDVILRQNLETKQLPLLNIAIEFNDQISDNDDYIENADQVIKSYKCKICKLNFATWNDYMKHKSSKQHRNVRVQCPVCYGLLTAQLYKKHLARHQSASHLICDVCGKLYRKDNLVRHLQLHNFDLPFQCQLCPYRGRFMESLRIHMRTHTGDKPFSCDECNLRFLTRSNLNRHLLTHKKERPFKCIECGRGFYTKRDVNVHFKSDHAGIKDFSCRMCGSKYGTRKAVMRHELRVHKRDKMAKGRMPLYLQAEYQKQRNGVPECNDIT